MASRKRKTLRSGARDPDDAPPLDAAWFAEADLAVAGRTVRRGRPPSTKAKHAISIRLDPDVLAHFRSGGPGWQGRINGALRRSMRAAAKRAG